MAHFAQLDENNTVTQVIVVSDEDAMDGENFCRNLLGGTWKQTSYNTRGGIHYAPDSHEPDGGVAYRKNYAGIGYSYDAERDAFIPAQPFPSWLLDEDTCWWSAPVPQPAPVEGGYWQWDEPTLNWVWVDDPTAALP